MELHKLRYFALRKTGNLYPTKTTYEWNCISYDTSHHGKRAIWNNWPRNTRSVVCDQRGNTVPVRVHLASWPQYKQLTDLNFLLILSCLLFSCDEILRNIYWESWRMSECRQREGWQIRQGMNSAFVLSHSSNDWHMKVPSAALWSRK